MKRWCWLMVSVWLSVLLSGRAAAEIIEEDFATAPATRGWETFGDTELFHWNEVGQHLSVTWDSSKPNSYFYKPLGVVLGKADDVQVSFDLRLEEIAVGVNPDKPFTFELAAGLINLRDATNVAFLRGTGIESPNLLELDYFPDSGFGATISPIIVSSNNQFIPSFTAPLEFTIGDLFHIEMRYTATNQTLATTVLRNGDFLALIKDVKLGESFTDYRVDTVSISSYSDEGAGGSLLATGIIDNIVVILPDPPRIELHGAIVDGAMEVSFVSRTNSVFTLERTVDWTEWRPVTPRTPGTDTDQVLRDDSATNTPPASRAFYRLRVESAE